MASTTNSQTPELSIDVLSLDTSDFINSITSNEILAIEEAKLSRAVLERARSYIYDELECSDIISNAIACAARDIMDENSIEPHFYIDDEDIVPF